MEAIPRNNLRQPRPNPNPMNAAAFFIPEWTTPVRLPDGNLVDGIFDQQTLAASIGIGIDAPNPQIALLVADAATLKEAETLIIKSKKYTIRYIPPEDDGIITIDLT